MQTSMKENNTLRKKRGRRIPEQGLKKKNIYIIEA
jgi:hypothetical protein